MPINAYVCRNSAGFSGPRGETDVHECASSPCRRYLSPDNMGETCRDSSAAAQQWPFSTYVPSVQGQRVPAGVYRCTINHKDVNECLSSPCQNGGTCLESSGGYSVPLHAFHCVSAAGYGGTRGELDVDECASNPCQANPGAKCLDSRTHPGRVAVGKYECAYRGPEPRSTKAVGFNGDSVEGSGTRAEPYVFIPRECTGGGSVTSIETLKIADLDASTPLVIKGLTAGPPGPPPASNSTRFLWYLLELCLGLRSGL